ncbi:hypothetical protein DVH24_005396 [Malus domestica]|uniref:Vacuolar protein sorting-associated protein 8 central domain-containing protein n=1 Tax=Malus domestica TaxID=3750 RepID=A0A498KRB3_MALDO|nr:hypothetical protein DVH24_005396 [Malus domestica]
MRTNAKPGAALAAAAAASRLMPTPHATAIKSRRSAGSGVIQKVLESSELDDNSVVSFNSNGDTNAIGSEVIRTNSNELQVDFGGELLRNGGVLKSENELEQASQVDEVSAGNAVEEEKNVSSSYENLTNLDANDVKDTEFSKNVEVVEECKQEIQDLDDNSRCSKESDTEDNEGCGDGKDDGGGGKESKDNNGNIGNGSDIDDDEELGSSITQLVEERIGELESRWISKKAEKKLRKPLEIAEELEKKQASTALHWEEGAAAEPMRLEGVHRGSTTLGYFNVDANNPITRTLSSPALRRDHGSPQVLAVHSNYIGIVMARGSTLVIPSKYSAHNADSMDAKMLILGLQGERSYAAVTSMCFNQQGDLLLAGYADGHITVWDVQRASAAKDSQVTHQFKAVTGDSKGLVLLHSSSVVPLLNRFSIKTQCLLDGQNTGTVLSASPFLFDECSGGALLSSKGSGAVSGSSIGGMMGGMVGGDAGRKLFNEGSSLVEEGVVVFVTHHTVLVGRLTPTLEVYARLSKPVGENMPAEAVGRVSLLALAWDRKVQVAKLVKSELRIYGKWSLESAAIGVAWLDDQMLVVLTVTGQLCLFAKDGTVIHQTSFSVDGFEGDDLIAYHTHFINIFGNPEKAYHNCVAVRGASVLRGAGDWMGALNMAMTIYDGQAHGVIDLPRTLVAAQEAIMSYLVELILSYVEEVFSYISVAFCNQIGKMDQPDDLKSKSSSMHSEIKEQYTRVGGVAVEFCVHIRRTDILFDEIFSKFVAVQQRDTFLELLEPYILKDMLGSLPPEIMQALVEHHSCKGWLQRVKQCVLHMDISSLDFNQVVRLPLDELLVVLRNSLGEGATTLGYRMLVSLKYCFSGLAFPPDLDTEATLDVLRCAFVEDEISKPDLSSHDSANANMELQDGNNLMAQNQNSMVQNTIDTLIHIISKESSQTDGSPDDTGSVAQWPSKKDIDHLFDYAKRRDFTSLRLLTTRSLGIFEVCGLIHTSRHQYLAALECYMKGVEEPIHAFSFINKTLLQLTDKECAAFRSEVISRIPELFYLNREGTFFLVIDHFTIEEGSHILSKLRPHPISLFLYLKTVIEVHLSGTLVFSSLTRDDHVRVKDQSKAVEAYLERISDFPKLLHSNPVNVTDDMIELYLEHDTAVASMVSSNSARTELFSNALKLEEAPRLSVKFLHPYPTTVLYYLRLGKFEVFKEEEEFGMPPVFVESQRWRETSSSSSKEVVYYPSVLADEQATIEE